MERNWEKWIAEAVRGLGDFGISERDAVEITRDHEDFFRQSFKDGVFGKMAAEDFYTIYM
jgi:hypothetical protein